MKFFQIQKFLFSNKNIAGCSLSSIIIVLALFGVLKTFWLPITIMAYIFGYIAGPDDKKIKFYHYKGEGINDYIGFISKVKKTVTDSQKLPQEAKDKIDNIVLNGVELLTFLHETKKNYSLTEDLFNLTAIFDAYLPKIINQYERLPSKYATEVKSSNGKTAKQMLIEQLCVLDKKVEEISYGMYEDDVTALRANGHFLKEKFSKTNLFELEINA